MSEPTNHAYRKPKHGILYSANYVKRAKLEAQIELSKGWIEVADEFEENGTTLTSERVRTLARYDIGKLTKKIELLKKSEGKVVHE